MAIRISSKKRSSSRNNNDNNNSQLFQNNTIRIFTLLFLVGVTLLLSSIFVSPTLLETKQRTITTTIKNNNNNNNNVTTTTNLQQLFVTNNNTEKNQHYCILQNSMEWLENPQRRLGNIEMSKEEFDQQQKILLLNNGPLLKHIDILMNHTLAWSNSRLVQSKLDMQEEEEEEEDDNDDGENQQQQQRQHRWLTRLTYAIIYHHQNPKRRQQQQQQQQQQLPSATTTTTTSEIENEDCVEYRYHMYGVGRWDMECPKQRFLAFSLQDQGVGAGSTLFEQCLFLGIASDRIVLPLNNLGSAFGSKAWTMSSCPRRDIQCVFAPPSHCVLTLDEILNGTLLKAKSASYGLFRNGQPPTEYDNPRVVWQSYSNYGLRVDKSNDLFFHKFYNLSQQLLHELPFIDDDDGDGDTTETIRRIWQQTSELILSNKPLAMKCFQQAAMMYILRPNFNSRKRLQEILTSNIPTKASIPSENNDDNDVDKYNLNYDPQKSIGIPIRVSDKCKKESTCLSFDEYMELAVVTWKQRLPNVSKPFVIITSESQWVFDKLKEQFIDNITASSITYPFGWIVNGDDVHPGSGRFRTSMAGNNVSADDGMISALSTLQLQLGSAILRANCCSKFHSMMGDMMEIGAGATINYDFQCLNHISPDIDPRFRICCWKSQGCLRQRNKDIIKWNNNSARV